MQTPWRQVVWMALHSTLLSGGSGSTKLLTAAISAELNFMLHLHSSSLHHKSGWSHVTRDAKMVDKVMAAVESNPFTAITPSLMNILTGQCNSTVKDNVTNVKVIGLKTLSESLSSDQKKTSVGLTPDIIWHFTCQVPFYA